MGVLGKILILAFWVVTSGSERRSNIHQRQLCRHNCGPALQAIACEGSLRAKDCRATRQCSSSCWGECLDRCHKIPHPIWHFRKVGPSGQDSLHLRSRYLYSNAMWLQPRLRDLLTWSSVAVGFRQNHAFAEKGERGFLMCQ